MEQVLDELRPEQQIWLVALRRARQVQGHINPMNGLKKRQENKENKENTYFFRFVLKILNPKNLDFCRFPGVLEGLNSSGRLV